MCQDCLREEKPDRGATALSSGCKKKKKKKKNFI